MRQLKVHISADQLRISIKFLKYFRSKKYFLRD